MYRLGRRRAADFIALLRMLTQAFPRAPKIVVICDNDSWTPTGFVDSPRCGTTVYEERTGSGICAQEVHPGI